jgi:hypothetical protein
LAENEDTDVLPEEAASTEEFTKVRTGVAESYFIFGQEIPEYHASRGRAERKDHDVCTFCALRF